MDANRIAHLELERRVYGPGRVANGRTIRIHPQPMAQRWKHAPLLWRLILAGCTFFVCIFFVVKFFGR